MDSDGKLAAGAAAVDITPRDSQFLFGYPYVHRDSTGVHDPLLSSALYLSDGRTEVMFITNDVIFISKAIAARVRRQIERSTGVPAANVMITATHTHSGPITADHISNEADPVVPKADLKYVAWMESRIAEAARRARRGATPARIGLAAADATGIGTNRRDPSGPADPNTPVLLVRSADGEKPIAAMLVCSMHPTVMHEDSKLFSADFLGPARQYLQRECLGPDCPILRHTGPAGNQSPRHVTKGNTFAEAERLGQILGRAAAKVLPEIELTASATLSCRREFIDLPARTMPPVELAESRLVAIRNRLQELRTAGAPSQEVRTAECDWFGAEETVTLARAAADGRIEGFRRCCLPAEIQVITVGPWSFVGWPGEVFVDYALVVKSRFDDTFVISLANGELQGYIVTEQAAAEGGYEASNALFGPDSGRRLVEKTTEMLGEIRS